MGERAHQELFVFFVKTIYKMLEQRHPFSFPWKCILKNRVQTKVMFFCLGGYLAKDLNS